MKEKYIKAKVKTKLVLAGWQCWFPIKSYYGLEKDIFGVFDCVAVKNNKVRFIQYTTLPNVSARRKKVREFLKKNDLEITAEVWGWSDKIKIFKIEEVKKDV